MSAWAFSCSGGAPIWSRQQESGRAGLVFFAGVIAFGTSVLSASAAPPLPGRSPSGAVRSGTGTPAPVLSAALVSAGAAAEESKAPRESNQPGPEWRCRSATTLSDPNFRRSNVSRGKRWPSSPSRPD